MKPDTIWGLYSGRFYALGWGDDPIPTYQALRRDAVLFDVPERPIELAGAQVLDFLRLVFCRRVDDLAIGRGRYAIACRDDGGILMDGVIFRIEAQRYWYVPANGEFVPWLHALAVGLDVRITDPESWVLQVQGPRSFDVLAALWNEPAARTLPYFHIRPCTIAGRPFFVSRTGWTGEMGFELYTLEQALDGPAIWTHILDVGRPIGLVASSLESMGIRRIEAGILDNGTDMDPSLTPYGAGLGRFVDLDASDFVGHGALRRADQRPVLFGVACPSAMPITGMAVTHGNDRVGRVTTGAWSPHLNHGIGYVRFDAPGDWVGRDVTLGDSGNTTAKVVTLPFYDAEKRIPRGLV